VCAWSQFTAHTVPPANVEVAYDDVAMAPAATGRRRYLDWARGIAVLLMIEAHTFDAWTRPASRHSVHFRNAIVLGGFAAPMFLLLAGVTLALAATRAAERSGNRAAIASACRRGLEVFVLAFLFRLQAFVLSPGAHPVTVFRVDILNVMGLSMVAAGVMWALGGAANARAAWWAAAAAIVALATPVVRSADVIARLPVWFQWHLRPAGDMTMFTLFPWAGFVFAGAAVGALLAAARSAESERRLNAGLAAASAVLVAVGFWTAARPSIYRASSFWTSSPTFFAIRAGILILALTMAFAVEEAIRRMTAWRGHRASVLTRLATWWDVPLARMGRSSLFIYWIHVELVYGYASWWWRGRLPLWGVAVAWAVFTALMYAAVVAKARVVSKREQVRHLRDNRAVDERAVS
jgi:uncharacterized membrane protein